MLDLDGRLRAGPLRVHSVWTPDRAARVARRSLRRRRAIALTLALAGASAGIAAIYVVRRAPQPVVAATSAPARALAAPGPLRFADGSTAEPLGQASELRVEEQSARRVRVRVSGGARFRITPSRARSFEVRAGDVLVQVLGTEFSVDRHDARTRVSVERGRVQVSWPGGTATLAAGEIGTFPPDEGAPRPVAAVAPQVEPSASVAPRSERAPRGWREWARKGDYGRAYAELQAKDAAVADDAADLMLAADVARLSAHPGAAVAPLRTLCERYPRDKRAPVAAFTLGRVLLDDLGRAREAADAFERADRLWPAGPLAEEALARAVEAWQRAGGSQRARTLAQRYLSSYPAGRHAESMRQALARDR